MTEAQYKANNKYIKANYKRFTVTMRKELAEFIIKKAKKENKSINQYIIEAVMEKIK